MSSHKGLYDFSKKRVNYLPIDTKQFWVYGLEDNEPVSVVILHALKVGTISLTDLTEHHSEITCYETDFSDEQIYIIRIRDVFDKWKSGYATEMINIYMNQRGFDEWNFTKEKTDVVRAALYEAEFKTFTNTDELTLLVVDYLSSAHDIEKSNLEWVVQSHANFYDYGMDDFPLLDSLAKVSLFDLKNVYFVEITDLSNPKFLEWLQEKDDGWKIVDLIPHKNKTPNTFWKNIDLFWREYGEGKIERGKKLVNPFELDELQKSIVEKQKEIDFIRENSERYIKL
jgi:hypothetical protein